MKTSMNVNFLFVCTVFFLSFSVSGALILVTDPPYNAQGDGVTDDTAAIQSAINAANSGDFVRLPSGTYKITDSLKMKAGIFFWGYGCNSSKIKDFGLYNGSMIDVGTGDNNVNIKYLGLDGSGYTGTQKSKIGVKVSNCDTFAFRSCKIQNISVNFPATGWGPHGIQVIKNTNNIMINDNVIENIAPNNEWGTGIRVTGGLNGCSNIQLDGNAVENCGRIGIAINDGCEYVSISYNTVSDINGIKMSIEALDSDYVIIENNTVDTWISVPASNFAAVRNNSIGNSSNVSAYIGLEALSYYSVYSNNTIEGPSEIGIGLGGSGAAPGAAPMYSMFLSNLIENSEESGALFHNGQTNYTYFYDCDFSNNYKGIVMNDGYNIAFEGCEFNSNDDDGFAIWTPNGEVDKLSIRNCFFQNNGDVSVNTPQLDHCDWFSNTVSGNGTNNSLSNSGGWELGRPNADFSIPSTALVNQPIDFINNSSDGGVIAMALWDFDAGYPSNTMDPTYTYESTGTYTVTLVVWDNEGKADRCSKTITILD